MVYSEVRVSPFNRDNWQGDPVSIIYTGIANHSTMSAHVFVEAISLAIWHQPLGSILFSTTTVDQHTTTLSGWNMFGINCNFYMFFCWTLFQSGLANSIEARDDFLILVKHLASLWRLGTITFPLSKSGMYKSKYWTPKMDLPFQFTVFHHKRLR